MKSNFDVFIVVSKQFNQKTGQSMAVWPFVAACEKMINFMAIYWVSWPSWMKAFIKAFYNKLSQTARVGRATIHNIQCTYVLDSF